MKFCGQNYSTLDSLFLAMCLQELKTSCLLFSGWGSSLYMMWNFSLRHTRHFLFVGLYVFPRSINSQQMSWVAPPSFISHTCPLSLVLSLPLTDFMSCLCSFHLSLKVRPVIPIYVSTCPVLLSVTDALYTTPACWHWPWTGHLFTPARQLQAGWFGNCLSPFSSCALCLETACPMLGMHL